MCRQSEEQHERREHEEGEKLQRTQRMSFGLHDEFPFELKFTDDLT
jgi:hypothetical protein